MKTDLSFLHVSALALLGTVAIVGFYIGRVAKRIRLPSVVGYMIFGVILGPSILKCKAKGTLTKTLYAIVGFDDGLAIIIFGFGASFAKSLLDILIIIFGVVLLTTGLSTRWHLSLILTNMMLGFVLVNSRHEALVQRVRAPLLEIMPLVFILFFCLAGANMKLSAIPALGSIGAVYILGRSAGKIGGARLGASFGRVEEKVKKYVGLGILSQAGVAIGLSLIVKQEFSQLNLQYNLPHAATIAVIVLTTITSTCVFFEIIGPILTKFALKKAGEIPDEAS
jgi:Kef-type K+ transport system membrane component KefB